MNDALSPRPRDEEPLDEGGTWLLDLVSAVDYLRRGYRPDLTVWDALAEALAVGVSVTGETDVLGHVDLAQPSQHDRTQRAVRVWVLVMAARYNANHHWPHPAARRTFPPRQLGDIDADG